MVDFDKFEDNAPSLADEAIRQHHPLKAI